MASGVPPTAGRVVAISMDTKTERWRHERPRIPSLGGPAPKPVFTDIGDPEQAEAGELLAWLSAGHFMFLGYREYDLAGQGEAPAPRPVSGRCAVR